MHLTFFCMYSLAPKEEGEYKKLLDMAKEIAAEGVKIRENVVTDELYDLIMFF